MVPMWRRRRRTGTPEASEGGSDDALVTVYRRSGEYLLAGSSRTTEGVWVHDGAPGVLGEAEADPERLGQELLACLALPRPAVPHPGPGEWPDRRRAGLEPILRAARVRSWRAFVSTADLVEVSRAGGSVSVAPMRAMPEHRGAFETDLARVQRLTAPSSAELGNAVLRAFGAPPGV
jgi:hypothetical protein